LKNATFWHFDLFYIYTSTLLGGKAMKKFLIALLCIGGIAAQIAVVALSPVTVAPAHLITPAAESLVRPVHGDLHGTVELSADYSELLEAILALHPSPDQLYRGEGDEGGGRLGEQRRVTAAALADTDAESVGNVAELAAYGNSGGEPDFSPNFSETNNQVEGVQESDIVKTDGSYIFVSSPGEYHWDEQTSRSSMINSRISVIRADNGSMAHTARLTMDDASAREMLLYEGKLIIVWEKSEWLPNPEWTPWDWDDDTNWDNWNWRFCCCNSGHTEYSAIVEVYDTSGDFSQPFATYSQDGAFHSARMIDNHIYLITNFTPNFMREFDQDDIQGFVPCYEVNGERFLVPPRRIMLPETPDRITYTTIGGLDVHSEALFVSIKSSVGSTSTVYASLDNIYLIRGYSHFHEPAPEWADFDWEDYWERQNAWWESQNGNWERYWAGQGPEPVWEEGIDWARSWEIHGWSQSMTAINKFVIDSGDVEFVAGTTVEGDARNQFHFDEHNGVLRVVTEIWGFAPETGKVLPLPEDTGYWREQREWGNELCYDTDYGLQGGTLYTFDENLNLLAQVHRIGFGENVQSVRFMGDLAYIVTFWQTDPLFAFDLSDPADPVLLGELKIPGFSRYLHSWDSGLLLGIGVDTNDEGIRAGLKMTMFDVADNSDLIERHVHYFDDIQSRPNQQELRWSWAYSPIEHDHRAALVSSERNIIGIPYTEDNRIIYAVFSYNNDGFSLIGEITADHKCCCEGGFGWDEFRRGLYINDYIYAITNNMIVSVKLLDGSIGSIIEEQRLMI
jgi:uncharacterized secreted protein with C-terminal beta-propeller domain